MDEVIGSPTRFAALSDIANTTKDCELVGSAVLQALSHIETHERSVRAWTYLDSDRTIGSGRTSASESTHLLSGVPVGVEDLIDVDGMPTGCGSRLRDNVIASKDAACVALMRSLGAIPIGKTVTTEFGYFAPGATRNPHDRSRTPGGSSSGSAAAVASGMVPLALGTQTAGSLTRPAAYCGVAGFVSARGSFDMRGVAGLSPTLDTLGLLTRNVSDLEYAWTALSGNGLDSQKKLESPRIGLWQGAELDRVSPEMTQALWNTAFSAADHGATVIELNLSRQVVDLSVHRATIMAYEAYRERSIEAARMGDLSEPLADLFRSGMNTSEVEYARARESILASSAILDRKLADFDVILGPAALGPAPKGLDATGSPILSRPWQALGRPVVTVPGCVDYHTGMPLGLQMIGRGGEEARLFAIAKWLEALL